MEASRRNVGRLAIAGLLSTFARGAFAQEAGAPFLEEQRGDPDIPYERVSVDPQKVAGLSSNSLRATFNPRDEGFPATLLSVAKRFVGTDRAKNEEQVVAFLDLFDLPFKNKDGSYVPYCACGLTYAAALAYKEFWQPKEPSKATTLIRGSLPELDYYHFYPTPSVEDMYYVARGKRRWLAADISKPPKPGYVVIYSFGREADHCGIVESVSDNRLTTIEFNTTNGLSGSQRNGGMVARRTRPFDATVKGFIVTDTKVLWK